MKKGQKKRKWTVEECLHRSYSFVPLLYQNRHGLLSKPGVSTFCPENSSYTNTFFERK